MIVILMVFFFMFFMLPRFMEMFLGFDVALPLPTRMLMNFSYAMKITFDAWGRHRSGDTLTTWASM